MPADEVLFKEGEQTCSPQHKAKSAALLGASACRGQGGAESGPSRRRPMDVGKTWEAHPPRTPRRKGRGMQGQSGMELERPSWAGREPPRGSRSGA